MSDRDQEEVDLWHASRAYLLGEIDADEYERRQKPSRSRLKRAILRHFRRFSLPFTQKPPKDT